MRVCQAARRANIGVLLAVGLAGCAYKPGAFGHNGKPFPSERATIGCLELGIERRPDMMKQAVIEYAFGNRCSKPEHVDLAYVTVMGRTADGTERRLVPYDPDSQLMALKLDGHSAGREALAYPSDEPLVQVCIDVASLAKRTPEQWMCFARLDQSGEPYAGEVAETETLKTETLKSDEPILGDTPEGTP